MSIQIAIVDEQAKLLEELGKQIGYKTAEHTLHYLIFSLADGVRRPGAWERQVVSMLFGEPSAAAAAAVDAL